jgi:hypothetical protein
MCKFFTSGKFIYFKILRKGKLSNFEIEAREIDNKIIISIK